MLSVDKINKLKEENAVLQAYKDVNGDFKKAWEELKAENEKLKARKDKYYQQTLDDEIQINELYQTLQEIKEIAKDNIIGSFSDKCDLADEILQKITKAEEE